jgi:hypothetical protein
MCLLMSLYMSVGLSRFIPYLMRFVIPNGQYISPVGNRLKVAFG